MILGLLIGASVAAASPATASPVSPGTLLKGAQHAIQAGRIDQARLMIARAAAAGAGASQLHLVLGELAFASGKYAEALAHYDRVSAGGQKTGQWLERAGIAALHLADIKRAAQYISRAKADPYASWRAWNACGVLADLQADWTKADECYERAAQIAPQEAAPLNNRGWSLLLRSDWGEALQYFERASELDKGSSRIARNLEMTRSALGSDLPRRRAGESQREWAARLNDAGVAATILGNEQKAVAAFTQAIDANEVWYQRAANNLEVLTGR